MVNHRTSCPRRGERDRAARIDRLDEDISQRSYFPPVPAWDSNRSVARAVRLLSLFCVEFLAGAAARAVARRGTRCRRMPPRRRTRPPSRPPGGIRTRPRRACGSPTYVSCGTTTTAIIRGFRIGTEVDRRKWRRAAQTVARVSSGSVRVAGSGEVVLERALLRLNARRCCRPRHRWHFHSQNR